jgi:cytochrome P450
VFGADGAELQQLRELLPKWVTLGSRLSLFPTPTIAPGRWGPWRRLAEYRRTYESLVDKLIERARRDPHLEDRTDVLSIFLRSTYDDGTTMSRSEIGDELLTLLAAGHETTASTLAWAFERISRHPKVLDRLVAEVAGDDNSYRQATIFEIQRNRTVIDFAGRHVAVPTYELGEWRLPQGYSILVSLLQLHRDPNVYPDPERFDPQRFLDEKPNTYSWVPFGGGTRRCVGAAFANMEMDVVLRTVLRHFTIRTTSAPGEKWHHRGVAFTPKKGGRVVVYRRVDPLG